MNEESMWTIEEKIKRLGDGRADEWFIQELIKIVTKTKLENTQDILIDVAGDFHGPLPISFHEKIKSIKSMENLRALNRKVIRTQSLEEFTELVNRAAQ